jgi:hypothetical protein
MVNGGGRIQPKSDLKACACHHYHPVTQRFTYLRSVPLQAYVCNLCKLIGTESMTFIGFSKASVSYRSNDHSEQTAQYKKA